MRDIQNQEWEEELEKSSFARKIKVIIGTERGIYEREEVKKTKQGLEITKQGLDWIVKRRCANIGKRKGRKYADYAKKRRRIYNM